MRINEIITESTELEEGWKSKLAGAALAGAAALGGGAASAAEVDDPSWSTAGYDSHIKADSSLTKKTSSDGVNAPTTSKDFQRRISDVTGPNAEGQYRVTVSQNGKIASQYVTKTPPPGWLVKESTELEESWKSKLAGAALAGAAALGGGGSDVQAQNYKPPSTTQSVQQNKLERSEFLPRTMAITQDSMAHHLGQLDFYKKAGLLSPEQAKFFNKMVLLFDLNANGNKSWKPGGMPDSKYKEVLKTKWSQGEVRARSLLNNGPRSKTSTDFLVNNALEVIGRTTKQIGQGYDDYINNPHYNKTMSR